MPFLRCVVLWSSFSLMSSFASAAPPPAAEPDEDPALAALLAEALGRGPDVLAAIAAWEAARERPAQAAALPDPMISVSYVNDGWSPTLGKEMMTQLGFMASQALPFPGKRGLRRGVARLEAETAGFALERARLAAEGAVRRAYTAWLEARELLALREEEGRLWEQIEGVARARYAVGQGAQPDVLRAQVETTRNRRRQIEQAAEVEIRLAELNRLAGRPAGTPLSSDAPLRLEPVATELAPALASAQAMSPERRSAAADVERARLRIDLARKTSRPDLTVEAGYMNRGGLPPMWRAGVAFNLPLRRGAIVSGVAEAEAEQRAAVHAGQSVELLLRLRTEERVARLRSAEEVAGLYEDGLIPQDEMAVEAAIANYQTGKVPFVSVLESLATLYEDRAAHIRVVAGHRRTAASLAEASLGADADGGMGVILPSARMGGGTTAAPGNTPAMSGGM